jgi:hypothetical protein
MEHGARRNNKQSEMLGECYHERCMLIANDLSVDAFSNPVIQCFCTVADMACVLFCLLEHAW